MRLEVTKLGIAAVVIALAVPVLTIPAPVRAAEPAVSTGWVSQGDSRVRLTGGKDAAGALVAGIEIEISEGWKTYWRNPGSSGVPPHVDWKGSQNLKSAELQFPAPHRIPDRDGDVIGYKKHVVLPVRVTPADGSKPLSITLDLEYGICKDICVPVQAKLTMAMPPAASVPPAGDALKAALAQVPRAAAARKPTDPQLRSAKVELTGAKPRIVLEAAYPGGGEGADVFLEAPEGLWVPLAKADGAPQGEVRRFVVDLTDGADVGELKGKTLRVTLVSAKGQSETTLKVE